MIEVMIAVVIVAIGLLGTVKLVVASQVYLSESQLRYVVNQVRENAVERARANWYGLLLEKYNMPIDYSTPNSITLNSDQSDAATAAEAIALYDQRLLYSFVSQNLPKGRVKISTGSLAGGQRYLDIWLVWEKGRSRISQLQGDIEQLQCPTEMSVSLKAASSCTKFRAFL